MSEKTKNILERAGKTFVEAFVSSIIANLALFNDALGDAAALKSVAISVGVGAVAAGISAAWNAISGYLVTTKKEETKNE